MVVDGSQGQRETKTRAVGVAGDKVREGAESGVASHEETETRE